MRKKRSNQIPLKSRVVSALRSLWRKSPERSDCLKAARVGYGIYQCALCKTLVPPKLGKKRDNYITIDHVDPIVPGTWETWDTFIDRLFNGKLQAICKQCHDAKSASEVKIRAEKRREERAKNKGRDSYSRAG